MAHKMDYKLNGDVAVAFHCISQFIHEQTELRIAFASTAESKMRQAKTDEERVHLLEEMCECSGECKGMLAVLHFIHDELETKMKERKDEAQK